MKTERKIIGINRHGVKPPKVDGKDVDAITIDSAQALYAKGVSLRPTIDQMGATPEQAYLRRTEKIRTLHSGESFLKGAFGYGLPRTEADFATPIEGLDIAIEPRLDYSDLKFNETAMNEIGPDAYVRNWVANPNQEMYDQVAVTPFSAVVESSRGLLKESIQRLRNTSMKLGQLSTHSGLA